MVSNLSGVSNREKSIASLDFIHLFCVKIIQPNVVYFFLIIL